MSQSHPLHDPVPAGARIPSDSLSLVSMINGTPRVSSLDVAARFGKRHDRVMRAIREICDNLPETYRVPNFGETFREVPGPNGAMRKEKCYSLTRDAFSLLAMGFTGKEALAWKVKYIEAFNAMEAEIARRQTPSLPAPDAQLFAHLPPLKVLSPASRRRLNDAVDVILKDVSAQVAWKARCGIWALFKERFGIPSYRMLPEARLAEGITFIHMLEVLPDGKARVRTTGQTPLPLPPTPSLQDAIRELSALIQQSSSFVASLAAAQNAEVCHE